MPATYYDVVLLLIPLLLLGVSGALLVAGLPLTVSLPAGGLSTLAVLGHAMFVRAPVKAQTSPGQNVS